MDSVILIIDTMHPSIIDMLTDLGLQTDYRPDIKREEIIQILGKYVGMIVRSKTNIDRELLQNAHQLKFIGRAGSGMDMIDLEVINEKNIMVMNAPEGNRDAVAEHTLGMLLNLLRKLHLANLEVKNLLWKREENRGYEIKGKTISIIGYGNVGKEVAKRLMGFDCKVLVYDIHSTDISQGYLQAASMAQIFEETDILTLHIPLTNETKYLVNEEYLNQFQKNIILINTSRGEIVSLKALKSALENGKVIGAGLDVLENEKLNTMTEKQRELFQFLQNAENVILSPHIAGWTHESYIKINQVLAEKIKKFLLHTKK